MYFQMTLIFSSISLQQISQDTDNHKRQYQDVHELGDELLSHPKAGDVSFVAAVLTNLEQNWRALEDVLTKRSEDLTLSKISAGTLMFFTLIAKCSLDKVVGLYLYNIVLFIILCIGISYQQN